MTYHNPIHIPFEPLTLRGVAFMNYNKALNTGKHFRALLDRATHINPEVNKLLDQCNLYIRFGELFYTPAYRTTLIHVDSEPDEYMVPGDMAKINYIGGGKGSLMHWYTTLKDKPYEPTGRNKFISYEPHEVKLISSSNLVGYNIAQTGIPHNITTSNEARYCVSLTLAIKDETPKLIPYEMMVALLSQHQLPH